MPAEEKLKQLNTDNIKSPVTAKSEAAKADNLFFIIFYKPPF